MSEFNKSYRIKANVGDGNDILIDTNIVQDYDTLDILSLNIKSVDTYRIHNSNYGVVVGRVLANNGFGVPNAKLSIFIEVDSNEGELVRELYPFSNPYSTDINDVRYNLLPDEAVDACHQVVGTFPNKSYMLDNDVVLEVFDKYYKYTTRTNHAGDYLIMGVPVGMHTLHMDLDLSDCGALSQRPRDFIYKGYSIEQFETPTKFKSGTNYQELSQVFSQDKVITVIPFWGDGATGESIGLTRADVNVAFKFEPTCVFIGSVVSDNSSNGITKKCRATENMGNMEEMVTGEGTIEMIRKTPSGDIESFAIKGNQLINGDGVWCYQIPMNLDYVMTDEFGNTVPTDDPQKGIPTRTSVRFRISMQDNEENLDNFFRCKVLVPHNPQFKEDGFVGEYDYEFGTYTNEESFRDLFWDNVYTVKSYIPRFQKRKVMGWKDKYFTGIKNCNFYGNNNPIPYNNIRIKLPLMFTIVCGLIKALIFITKISNLVMAFVGYSVGEFARKLSLKKLFNRLKNLKLNVITEGLCPDLENWYFAPITSIDLSDTVIKPDRDSWGEYNILKQTLAYVGSDEGKLGPNDEQSNDYQNKDENENAVCLTTKQDYLIACIEMNLAMEYRVINFDFYNDWINGMIYVPRFMRYVKAKKTAGKKTIKKAKIKGCMDDTSIYSTTRRYVQQCAIGFNPIIEGGYTLYSEADNPLSTSQRNSTIRKSNNFHKKSGFNEFTIFGDNGGICHEHQTSRKQHVYYMKPCEWNGGVKVNLYATDIVLLGSLKPCNENGLPQAYKYLSSTSYIMPPNLALTNMENNGPIYVNDKNTICTGSNNQVTLDINKDKGVQMAPMGDLSTDELELYKNTGNPDIDTQFGGNELSDIIPVTEMAGISWNYTGPAQGEINEKQMYYPGGHFLGISCVNSQTNIKSCINLSRICEVGTTMSQRKEDIVNVDGDDVKYIYTSPTGFISGNDINGEDFRTMFATMNHRCLKATKLNLETGYKYYDLEFVKPISFNGAFGDVAKMSKASYNNTIKLSAPDEEKLKEYGIGLGNNYDPNEVFNTQTRTIEDASVDYYRFRLGLDYEDLNKRSFIHNSKFLLNEAGKKYLPQYENSYYFYFGLKAGATAIDEFNKLFYSTCENNVSTYHVPEINIIINDINLSEQTGDVTIVVDNIDLPLQQIILTINDEKRNITEDFKNNYVIKDGIFENLAFGNYYIEIVDFNGIQLGKSFKIGTDLFSLQKTVHDFNVNDALDHISTKDIFRGGFVEITDVNVNEYYKDSIEDDVKVILKPVGGTDIFSGTTTLNTNESINIYVNEANIDYEIYLQYKIKESNNYSAEVYIDKFSIKDGSSVYLAMGWPTLPFYEKITTSSANTSTILTPFSGELETTMVPLNLGGEKWWENKDLDDDNGILGNWLKRVSIYKTTDEETLFSNNVFAVNGRKVIWGVPQNYKGIYNKNGIFCSEVLTTEYAGYSLDDEASYYGTQDGKHYSAIAIKDNLVSGDYFAILNNGRLIINNTCKGYFPNNNTGYVFKSLPDEELYFYTYNGDNNYEHPESETNGVYYSSFEYPVIEKPFSVDVNFYIWAGYDVYMAENVDNIAEVRYSELGGRTEVTIKNGIRYKNSFGLLDSNNKIVSGFSFSNIINDDIKNNILTGDTITLSGMNVTVETENSNGDIITEIIPAFEIGKIDGKEVTVTYTKGVSGVSNAYYDISEGYPGGNEVFATLINSYQDNINYANYFGEVAKYKYYNGRGIEVSLYGQKGFGSGKGKVCKLTKNNTSPERDFLVIPDGNSKYVYLKGGKDKKPIYYILCEYTYSDKHSSPPGELCFMVVRYHNRRNFQLYFEYTEGNDSGDSSVKNYSYYSDGAKTVKYNIDGILKKDSGWADYVKPIVNYRINCNSQDWKKQIDIDYNNYIEWRENASDITSADTFYYVDTYNGNVHKIYPLLREDNSRGDNIELEDYYIGFPYTGGSAVTHLILTIDDYSEDDVDVGVNGDEITEYASNKLYYSINNTNNNVLLPTNIGDEDDWYKINIDFNSMSGGEYITVDYTITISVKNEDNINDYLLESIYFYTTNKQNGVRLDIERLKNKNYHPYLTTNKRDYKNKTYFLKNYNEWFNEKVENNWANVPNEEVQHFITKVNSYVDENTQILEIPSKNNNYNKRIYSVFESKYKNYDWLTFEDKGNANYNESWKVNINSYGNNPIIEEVGNHIDKIYINDIDVYVKANLTGGIKVYDIKPYHNDEYVSKLVIYQTKPGGDIDFNEDEITYIPWIYFGSGISVDFKTTLTGVTFDSGDVSWDDGSSWNIEVSEVISDDPVSDGAMTWHIYLKAHDTGKDRWFYDKGYGNNYPQNKQNKSDVLIINYNGIELRRNIELKPNLSFLLSCEGLLDGSMCQIYSTIKDDKDFEHKLTQDVGINNEPQTIIPLFDNRSGKTIVKFNIIQSGDKDNNWDGLYYLTDGNKDLLIREGNKEYPIIMNSNINDEPIYAVCSGYVASYSVTFNSFQLKVKREEYNKNKPIYIKVYASGITATNELECPESFNISGVSSISIFNIPNTGSVITLSGLEEEIKFSIEPDSNFDTDGKYPREYEMFIYLNEYDNHEYIKQKFIYNNSNAEFNYIEVSTSSLYTHNNENNPIKIVINCTNVQ